MPKSVISSPARRACRHSSPIALKTYGGSRLILGKSIVLSLARPLLLYSPPSPERALRNHKHRDSLLRCAPFRMRPEAPSDVILSGGCRSEESLATNAPLRLLRNRIVVEPYFLTDAPPYR